MLILKDGETIGGIAGEMIGANISQCGVSGRIRGSSFIGGISGTVSDKSKIEESFNNATIDFINNNQTKVGYIGGLCGTSSKESEITNCYNTGEVNGYECWNAGIVGSSTRGTKIANCYNAGNVNSTLIKYTNVINCIGGITGNIYYDSNYKNVKCIIENCYNIGKIYTKNASSTTCEAGIVGYISQGYANIQNCYNSGSILNNITDAGGIVGRINNKPGIVIENCKSVQKAIGTNQATSSNATVTKTNSNVTSIESVIEVINNNDDRFIEDSSNLNNGYPILKWQLQENQVTE